MTTTTTTTTTPPSLPYPIGRVKLSDITPHEGSPSQPYLRAIDALSGSLTHHNAAIIELDTRDAAILRCALESVGMYFRAKPEFTGAAGSTRHRTYVYRSGRSMEDGALSPPCMGDAFQCLGNVARAALSAVARHIRLRSDIFNHLLDDAPLAVNEVSSSLLIAAHSCGSADNGKEILGGGKAAMVEVEKGLLTLITSDSPGIQVCDPNGRWYVADQSLVPGDLLLLTGRSLSHVTAGLRPAASHRVFFDYRSTPFTRERASLAFKLMPQSNAILDCSPIAAAGHVIPQCFVPISVSQFMDDLPTEEDTVYNHPDHNYECQNHLIKEPSLRSVLSDPLSGMFLEDAMVVSCGHSFGGHLLKKVIEMARCSICDSEIEVGSLIPNHALRNAATTVKNQDERRLFHNAALRKRRKEVGESVVSLKILDRDSREMAADSENTRQMKGVKYPFSQNEKVIIKGNRRTSDKFVGREAVVSAQCSNGWYLLKLLDSGDYVRLQYRSLQKIPCSQLDDRLHEQEAIESSD